MDITIGTEQHTLTNKMIDRFHNSYIKTDSCWISNNDLVNGYARFSFTIKGKEYKRRMHVISYAIHRGPIAENQVVRHMCHNRQCCNPEHLELGLQLDNIKDNSVATIQKIRLLIAEGLTDNDIWKRLNSPY